ncbi:hypothetical protein [Melittangium boletus]|uniref:Uncharacterized protein n=1 Tax=Melittangium boletus DSM 14713 TaxID=1294270 RepID=A0A250I979_9BACT|nr:hypothetical protein [Melittangium boletus]ATB27712.1 hypothetical protein MEBOL_001157 [Melittangium boletus DSM 14713]
MGFLKFLVWTGCAVGLGVFLATVEIDGRTPVELAQRTWKRHAQPPRPERMKNGLTDALDEAEKAVKRTTKQVVTAAPAAPRERITHEDRAAIDRIIAQKK